MKTLSMHAEDHLLDMEAVVESTTGGCSILLLNSLAAHLPQSGSFGLGNILLTVEP